MAPLLLQLTSICQIIPNDFIQFYLHFDLPPLPTFPTTTSVQTLTNGQGRIERREQKRLKYVRTNTKRTICFKLSVATLSPDLNLDGSDAISGHLQLRSIAETQNARAKWTLSGLTDPIGHQKIATGVRKEEGECDMKLSGQMLVIWVAFSDRRIAFLYAFN